MARLAFFPSKKKEKKIGSQFCKLAAQCARFKTALGESFASPRVTNDVTGRTFDTNFDRWSVPVHLGTSTLLVSFSDHHGFLDSVE